LSTVPVGGSFDQANTLEKRLFGHYNPVDPDRSFERMYRRHRRAVYGSVLKDLRDPDEAEDVTQVAFLNAYRAMRRGDRPEKPRAWLLTIARNVVRRRARLRAGRPQEVELDPELVLALDDVESSTSEDICAGLRRLTESQQRAILLREIQGRSYGEIAEELDLSLAAVEALIFRARRALAEELELVDRAPVVQRRKAHGLLALPGFAKLGSLGFSFGRAGLACLVGCTVVGVVPVGGGGASEEPAAVVASAPSAREPAGPPAAAASTATKRTRAHKQKGGGRHTGTHTDGGHAGAQPQDGTSGQQSLSLPPVASPQLPVELPPVTVPQLPPVTVPPLAVPQLPQVTVPPLPPVEPALPPVPDVPEVQPLPGATS
jgi:RNA polymerase sigma-70 factor (ECF subfamily)